MKTDRLQLLLIPDLHPPAQPLPTDARKKSVELIARMVLRLVDKDRKTEAAEDRDERR